MYLLPTSFSYKPTPSEPYSELMVFFWGFLTDNHAQADTRATERTGAEAGIY